MYSAIAWICVCFVQLAEPDLRKTASPTRASPALMMVNADTRAAYA